MLLADRQYLKEERMQAMFVNLIRKNFRGRKARKEREETNLIFDQTPLYRLYIKYKHNYSSNLDKICYRR